MNLILDWLGRFVPCSRCRVMDADLRESLDWCDKLQFELDQSRMLAKQLEEEIRLMRRMIGGIDTTNAQE